MLGNVAILYILLSFFQLTLQTKKREKDIIILITEK